jgi:hypothetical protein
MFLIAAIRFDGVALEASCCALFVLAMFQTWRIMAASKSTVNPHSFTVTAAEDTGGEVSGYLASYLLPFITVASPSWRDLLGYCLYLALALLVYIRSDLVRVNPTLYVFGYRVLKVQDSSEQPHYLITRHTPTLGTAVSVVDVAGVEIRIRSS